MSLRLYIPIILSILLIANIASAEIPLSVNLRFYETYFAKIGYQIEYKDHQNYDSFNFLENSGLLQLSKTFSTRTTLQLFSKTRRREDADENTNNI